MISTLTFLAAFIAAMFAVTMIFSLVESRRERLFVLEEKRRRSSLPSRIRR